MLKLKSINIKAYQKLIISVIMLQCDTKKKKQTTKQ